MNELVKECVAHVWAMDPTHLRRFIARLGAIPQADLSAAIQKRIEAGTAQAFDNLQGNPNAEKPPRAEVTDGVAHIRIAGPILKQVPSFFEMFGIEATSTETVREMLSAAVEDPKVKSIVLDVDSPGGTVDGVAELAGDISAARDLKPVHAHASDLMASAAYWLGCQAGSVSCGPTAAVGSIGVYSVMEDTSAIAEKHGVKVHVIASHPLKGAGVEGAPITDAQLDDAQRVINSYAALFTAAVAGGRGIDPDAAAAVSTGQVWIGAECIALGLVDGTQSAADAHANSIRGAASQPRVSPRARTTAAPAAPQEPVMDPKEAAALAAENALLKAKLEAAEANAKAIVADQKKAVLSKYADRFHPSASASFDKLAEVMSLAELEQHMQAMPQVTRPSATALPAAVQAVAAGVLASIKGTDNRGDPKGGEDGAKQVGRFLGISVKQLDAKIAKYADVRGVLSNGKLVMKDGSIITRAELDATVAA